MTAVDANPRSLGFAALNARLNRVPNVSVEGGSWFEPAIGRRFDLIVSNPPYVVSPDSGLIYRDSGLPGDALCRRIVTEMPDHLNEDGLGHVLCNWVHAASGDPSAPVRAWVEDSAFHELCCRRDAATRPYAA